ncbi:hypothetical protein ACFPC0_21705 [Streptomyces andamanensis]|uniref:Restriction endonuclease type IV Mrr domain-containing protein n=1 Tax=Streptomyces andamanensis TaxID=1565035 RepID=A0ABV8TIG5_9ACTN
MRVSEHYNIKRTQGTLDFVDVDIKDDVPVYIDPGMIRHLPDDWGKECLIMLTTFFDSVLDAVRTDDKRRATYLLGNLGEPNETHLGFSSGPSAGRGFSARMGVILAEKLAASEAARTGLIEDLEDTAFFVDRVGKDIVSDITTNIIRGSLISYTQQISEVVGIPLIDGVESGPVWNPHKLEWEQDYVRLPVADDRKLLLVPKVIVRREMLMTRGEYYRSHLVPALRTEELDNPASRLVKTLKDGSKRVNTIDIQAHYGTSKPDVTRETLQRPDVYAKYRDSKKTIAPPAISHEELSEASKTPLPDFEKLLNSVIETPPGREHAGAYHRNIESLFTALFYPSLTMPEIEEEIHEGRKRIDITYTNVAQGGFFRFLVRHKIKSTYIMIECKNYGKDVGNPELDQIASRFSPLRGQFGILACRSFTDKERFLKRCRDTALDYRGYVLALDDSDLVELVKDARYAIEWMPAELPSPEPETKPRVDGYPLLHRRFKALVN